jgi:hypothetical protein
MCVSLVTLSSGRCDGNVGRPLLTAPAGRTINVKGRAMSDSDEFTGMSDPDFLAECKRVRETLEALTERYRMMNIEFDRRAGVAWTSASQG